jgi:uncharacterized protein (DUF697 family)
VSTEPPTTLLRLYDKLTGLLEKLPGGLQKPVLRELQPIRDLFLDTRPPRLMLVGDSVATVPSLLAALGVSDIHTGESHAGWRAYSIPTGAEIQILDARNDVPAPHIDQALARSAPEILCAALPATAQLAFARFTNARRAQALIASSLLKSFSGLCGVIGMQPIPLADLPVLLTLQSLMVGLIIHTTGRRVDARLISEFLGALGLGAAAGFAFREAARIAIKIVPFWGHAVSGLIAGAGTYAIGKAAIAYFIDDAPLAETRRLFRKMLRARKP